MVSVMYAAAEDGTLTRIPEEDAVVLDRYRDGDRPTGDDLAVCLRYPIMPLVYEPQYCGDPCPLYPLIDEQDEDGRYACYPMPGTVVESTAGRAMVVTMAAAKAVAA
jgi:hypothetical protein